MFADHVNAGACGGEPFGGQTGPQNGTGPGAAAGAEGAADLGLLDALAAAAVVIVLLVVGFNLKTWKNFKKSLPGGIRKAVAEANNEFVDTGKTEKIATVCDKIDRMTFLRKDARKAAGDFTAMGRALINHQSGTIRLCDEDYRKVSEAFNQVSKAIGSDTRWFFD